MEERLTTLYPSELMEAAEEQALIEQAKSDPEAFVRLYREYLPEVYGFVSRRVSSREAAEDITSDTFEKALRALAGLKEDASFRAWLFRIARNSLIDYYRATGSHRPGDLTEALLVANGKSAREAEKAEVRASIERMLGQMPEKYRTMLELYYVEGLSATELAQVTGLTPAQCSLRVFRATRKFGEMLDRKGIRSIADYAAYKEG